MEQTNANGFRLTTTATRGRDPRLPDPHAGRYESVLGVQRNLTRLLASSSVASVIVTPEREAQAGEAPPRPSVGDGSVVIIWRRKVASGVDTASYTCSVEMVPVELSLALASPTTLSVEVGIPSRIAVLSGGGLGSLPETPRGDVRGMEGADTETPSTEAPRAETSGTETSSAGTSSAGTSSAETPSTEEPAAGRPTGAAGEVPVPPASPVPAVPPVPVLASPPAAVDPAVMEARAAERLAQLRASLRPPS